MIISSHKITNAPCQSGVVTVSNNPQKNIMPGFRMLAFKVWRGRVHSKTFESFLLFPFPILKNIQITHTLKTVQKVVLIIFEINLKIN
jgi:hypothetical protein